MSKAEIFQGWKALLSSAFLPAQAFITMNFHRQIGEDLMRQYAKALFARLDRKALGRNYYRRPDARADMIGIIEKPATNPHIHWIGSGPFALERDPVSEQSEELTAMFKLVVPSGTIDFRWIWKHDDLAGYLSKELFLPARSDRVLFTRDFWPAE